MVAARHEAPLSPMTVGDAARTIRVVALGGGTGLPMLLRGLKGLMFPDHDPGAWSRGRDRLTAVVTVADDGGSSGRLRRAYRVLPPGDVRNCLLALSSSQSMMTPLFSFRFKGNNDVGGHSLGNLILSALSHLQGDFCEAVEQAGRMLGACGRILPATLSQISLTAEFDDGSLIEGESRIPGVRRRIRRLQLHPKNARILPEAAAAIEAADVVVIGPGSLYTSLMPILLIDGVVDAIAHTRGRVALVMNLMTEPGETEGYTSVDHVVAIRRHAPRVPIHDLIVNTRPIGGPLSSRYSAQGAVPVAIDRQLLRALGYRLVERDLLGADGLVRHGPAKLALAVLEAALTKEEQ
jgi:uncharacterized cofD-like protein